jgi:hypothetical protein
MMWMRRRRRKDVTERADGGVGVKGGAIEGGYALRRVGVWSAV